MVTVSGLSSYTKVAALTVPLLLLLLMLLLLRLPPSPPLFMY